MEDLLFKEKVSTSERSETNKQLPKSEMLQVCEFMGELQEFVLK